LSFSVAEISLGDTITVVTLPLALQATTSLRWIFLETLETAEVITVIRSVGTLSFAITHLGFNNALSVGTGPLGGWVAAALFSVVESVFLEAALGISFIRFIGALGFTVTHSSLEDALTVSTCPLALWIATALFISIERVTAEATVLVTFIGSIGTLGFTITSTVFGNTVTVTTGPLGLWVAAASLVVVE
jgi:hypothetical protein